MHAQSDSFEIKKREQWRLEARAKAEQFFGDEVRGLDARIASKRAEQRAIMDFAGYERRTLDRVEARNFDLLQSYVDETRRKLDSIYRRALPPGGLMV
jgi:hypothetical protein